MKIKVCGITNLDDARLCVDAGADALGFIFVEGTPRFVAPETAPGGRSLMLPDLSSTSMRSNGLRPLLIASRAGATPSSTGISVAGVSPVCFETAEHSTSGEATMYDEMR